MLRAYQAAPERLSICTWQHTSCRSPSRLRLAPGQRLIFSISPGTMIRQFETLCRQITVLCAGVYSSETDRLYFAVTRPRAGEDLCSLRNCASQRGVEPPQRKHVRWLMRYIETRQNRSKSTAITKSFEPLCANVHRSLCTT